MQIWFFFDRISIDNASVAQQVEQFTRNEQVTGPNPVTSSKKRLGILLNSEPFQLYPSRRYKSIYVDKVSLKLGIGWNSSTTIRMTIKKD